MIAWQQENVQEKYKHQDIITKHVHTHTIQEKMSSFYRTHKKVVLSRMKKTKKREPKKNIRTPLAKHNIW